MAAKKKLKREENELRLTDKKHPPLGIASTILAVISIIAFAGACIISGQNSGNAGITVGIIGILCFVLSVVGFIMALISLHQDDIRPVFPTLGSVGNGLLVIMYMILYILGATM